MTIESEMSYRTSDKKQAACGKVKDKMPLGSPVTVKLLEDCNVRDSDVKYMSSVPLVNVWSTFIEGEKVAFCYSISTLDGRFHIRDYNGNVTTPKVRDRSVDAILSEFLIQSDKLVCGQINKQLTESSTHCLPSKEDFESAYRTLSRLGESVSIDTVLDKIEANANNNGLFLKNNWRMLTEANIDIWSKK